MYEEDAVDHLAFNPCNSPNYLTSHSHFALRLRSCRCTNMILMVIFFFVYHIHKRALGKVAQYTGLEKYL